MSLVTCDKQITTDEAFAGPGRSKLVKDEACQHGRQVEIVSVSFGSNMIT